MQGSCEYRAPATIGSKATVTRMTIMIVFRTLQFILAACGKDNDVRVALRYITVTAKPNAEYSSMSNVRETQFTS